MKPLNIYLCDLTHDTIFLVSDTIPINIGFIAAYTKKIFGDAVDISLFKIPQTAIDAITDAPPDILGLSNYSWNSELSERVARLAKGRNPEMVTVQGGTNFPHKAPQRRDFLLRRPGTEFHTIFEGEIAFANIVERVLAMRGTGEGIFAAPVDGTVFIEPSTRNSADPVLISGETPGRTRALDDIPSPYLSGLMDHFFDGRLPPMIETNRGCKHLKEQGRASRGEIILGLPGETRDSFIEGVEQVIEAEVSSTTIYSLMLLHGTDFKDPDYRENFKIVGKFRIVPLNFGEYGGEKVFDYEEVGIANRDMSFDDYLFLRGFALMVESLHNGRPFEEFFLYALNLGLKRTEFMRYIQEHISEAPDVLQQILHEFIQETRDELWDSEEELVAHYRKPENFQRLLEGEVGGNLIYKYKLKSIVFAAADWIHFLAALLAKLIDERVPEAEDRTAARREIACIAEFCHKKIAGILDSAADLSAIAMESEYDIGEWVKQPAPQPLADYYCNNPMSYAFEFTETQLTVRRDQFERYGTDVNALSKIVTRISTLESLFRKVRTLDGQQARQQRAESNGLTRYSLSH